MNKREIEASIIHTQTSGGTTEVRLKMSSQHEKKQNRKVNKEKQHELTRLKKKKNKLRKQIQRTNMSMDRIFQEIMSLN